MDGSAGKSRHGGKRVGAGRPRTRQAVKETALDVIMRRRFEGGCEPLQVMLDAMDAVLASNGAVAAFPFAQACAPYMHAKLGNIEHIGPRGNPIAVAAVSMTQREFRELALEVAAKV